MRRRPALMSNAPVGRGLQYFNDCRAGTVMRRAA
jgi:hypothetical protein